MFESNLVTKFTMIRLASLLAIVAMGAFGNAQPASAGGPECEDVLVKCVSSGVCPDEEEPECEAGSSECPGVLQCGPENHPNCTLSGYESLWCAVGELE